MLSMIQAGLGDVRGARNTTMLQMPTRDEILALQIGDAVHGPLGPSHVVSIHARGEDTDGRAFVCCYLWNGPDSTISDSYKEDTLERSIRASNHFMSAELDHIESRERAKRKRAVAAITPRKCSFAFPGTYGHECGMDATCVAVFESERTHSGFYYGGRCNAHAYLTSRDNDGILRIEPESGQVNNWR